MVVMVGRMLILCLISEKSGIINLNSVIDGMVRSSVVVFSIGVVSYLWCIIKMFNGMLMIIVRLMVSVIS